MSVLGTADNVILGVGRIYTAPLNSSLPAEQWIWPSEWQELGYTVGGISLKILQELRDVEVDQVRLPLLRELVSQRCILRTRIAEATLRNLQLAIPDSVYRRDNITDGDLDTLGVGGADVVPAMFGFEGLAPGGKARSVILYNGLQIDRALYPASAIGATLIPLAVLGVATADGLCDVIDGDTPTESGGSELLLRHYGWTAGGESAVFDLPRRIASGSDPLVFINGVAQSPGLHYDVAIYAGYTRLTFLIPPGAGDYVDAWYQAQS